MRLWLLIFIVLALLASVEAIKKKKGHKHTSAGRSDEETRRGTAELSGRRIRRIVANIFEFRTFQTQRIRIGRGKGRQKEKGGKANAS
jgi:hypothetical protein